MTNNKFKDRITGLSFTVSMPLSFKYKFFAIIHIIAAWKDHTKDVFTPILVSFSDHPIYIWTKTFTRPG